MACFKKLGNKWYLESEVESWAKKIKKINSLTKLGTKSSAKKIAELNSEIADIQSLGIDDVRDSSGDIQIDDIFNNKGLGKKTKQIRERVLDNLTIKSHGLAAQGIHADDVYTTKQAEFDKLNISIDDIAKALTTKWDYLDSLSTERGALTSFESASNKSFLPKYLSKLRNLVSKKDALHREQFKGLWKANKFRSNRIKAAATKHSVGLESLNSFLEDGPGKSLDDKNRQEISRYLQSESTGILNVIGLPNKQLDQLQDILDEVRISTDLLSSLEQTYGGISNRNVIVFQNNKGTYLTRSYRAFQNKDWVNDLKEGKYAAILDDGVRALTPSLKKRKDSLGKKVQAKEANQGETFEYNALVAALSNPTATADYILNDLEQLSSKSRNEASFDRKGKLNTKTIKQRKELPPAIRKLLGDIDNDPAQAVSLAAIRTTERAANNIFQSEVASIMNDKGLFLHPTEAKEIQKRGWVEVSIAGESNAGFRNILLNNGKQGDKKSLAKDDRIFVPEEMVPVMKGMMEVTSGISPELIKTPILDEMAALSAVLRKTLTVYNLAGQSSNVLGNPSFAAAAGDLRPQNAKIWAKEVLNATELLVQGTDVLSTLVDKGRTFLRGNKIDKELSSADRELMSLAVEFGFTDSSAILNSIKEITDNNRYFNKLQEARDKLKKSSNIGAKAVTKVGDVLGFLDAAATESYALGDSIFKVAALKLQLDSLSKDFGYKNFADIAGSDNSNKIKDKQKITEIATSLVRATYPNYNELYSFANKSRASKIVAPFISFVSEQVRTTHASIYLQQKYARDSSLPKSTRVRMAQSLGQNIAIRGIAGVMIPTLATALFNTLSPEEEDLIRDELAYDFEKDTGILIDNDDGTYDVWNWGYFNPAGFAGELYYPIHRSLVGRSDKPLVKAIIGSAAKVFSPFLQPEIGVAEVIRFIMGQDEYGRDIIEADTVEGKYNQVLKYLGKFPGFNNLTKRAELGFSIDQLSDQLSQEVERRGPGKQTEREIAIERKLNLAKKRLNSKEINSVRSIGFRHTTHNKEQDIYYKLFRKDKTDAARSEFKSAIKSDSFNRSHIEKEYEKANETYKKGLEDIKKFYDRIIRTIPNVDMDAVFAGKRSLSKSVDKAPYKIFSRKEIAYIKGKADIPDLTIKEVTDRLKVLDGGKTLSSSNSSSKKTRTSRPVITRKLGR